MFTHLPWHILLFDKSLTVSELVLHPLRVCDQGNGGKLARRNICLPERVSELFLVDVEGLVASSSKESKSFAGGNAKCSRISFGWHNGKSGGQAGISGLPHESWLGKR